MKTFILPILVLILSCRNAQSPDADALQGKSDETAGAVVTFVYGKVQVNRKGMEWNAKVGDQIRVDDLILTKSGSIDLQTYRGEVIRIKEASQVSFTALPGKKSEMNTLHVVYGNLLIKGAKLKNKEELKITSPTMVAGVRGTTFAFELVKDGVPKVKVYEGAVAMAFRTPFRTIKDNSLADTEAWKELVKSLDETEIILEAGENSKVSPKLNELVFIINQKVSEKLLSQSDIEAFQMKPEEISKESFTQTPQEKAEIKTLVQLEDQKIEKALSASDSTDPTLAEAINLEHDTKRNAAFQEIASEAKEQDLDKESEIQTYYSILESIHTTKGEVFTGAIIAQLGDTLIVHTTKGVREMKADEIEYIEYKNFRLKAKAKKK
ncbi:sigma factor regulatory protein, FecR/PupR family [Leptospira ryugenii]|uniref:Sigma factor regulatory protein, FecR/PupR family n=1 Tax=Leptospira ryugenii TaxID=1917863 RepID=A0A2P2E179_9LEPT|nr:FecR family protein [Leptospira ryugenii]GBF50641.1 sigma factor regulatory protein, FecR/PupR family [Leptospira ryugenii]